MDEPGIKAQPRKKSRTVDGAAAAAGTVNGSEAAGEQRDELREQLHDIGRQLRDSTKVLREELARQARLRPLAVFGAAFVAGIVISRALRR